MRQVTLPLCVTLLVLSTGCGKIDFGNKIRGSGSQKAEKRDLGPFTAVEVKCHGDVTVNASGPQSLEIKCDDNIVPLITTEVKNGTLYIASSQDYSPSKDLQVTIAAPHLEKYVFQGAGDSKLSNIKNDRFEIVVTGAGDLSASGETKAAQISFSGAGDLDAKNLQADTATVNAMGAGSVDVFAREELDATATGVGNINYYGNPKSVKKHGTGIGAITQK